MKFIPIIGTISSGKSTFLDSFLGIDVLQTGVLTTTKFVCLIKHSKKTLFYHVIPRKQNDIIFDKEGDQISDVDDIKTKIEKINEQLENKKSTSKNDIFYMLETPIKNIKNDELLSNCYFMDIPGLNEYGATYIETIFSLININDILFEIMIFDSLKIGQQNILDIFKNLENKNCLKKEGNLYILNKIDRYTKGGNPIQNFQSFFYHEFEDDKRERKEGEPKILINFSKNTFIPLNSILYKAETEYENDFYSMILKELFQFLENNLREETFYEYIEKRLDAIIKQNSIDINKIDEEVENIQKEDLEIIKKCCNEIDSDELKSKINTLDISIELKFKKKEVKETLKKLYVIHKCKLNKNFCFSQSYYDLEDFINNVNKNKNFSDPPAPLADSNKNSLELLKELNEFIKEKLKGEYSALNSSLSVINENFAERKIRISFIGNISTGKSTIINCIIGEEILPSNDGECTYRGVIIKHKDIDHFRLYKAKLNIVGSSSGCEYYNFKEEDKPYCIGNIDNIKNFLNNKNNDKNITDNDAYIVIHGRLKIFDFIKLDKKYLDKVEFVDLPGHNRKENKFINFQKEESSSYYHKILKFTNSIVFILEPDSNDDKNNVEEIKEQYGNNKNRLDKKLADKSIDTCIFLINKCDLLPKQKDRDKVEKKIKSYISEVETKIPSNWNNISFFSGKYFNEFLLYYKDYVELIDKNPLLLLYKLYKEWSQKWLYPKNLKSYIISNIEKINKNLKLDDDNEDDDDDDEKEIQIPKEFNDKIKNAFIKLNKFRPRVINSKEEGIIISYLYKLYLQLKNKDFKNTNYSKLFFNKLKEVIVKSSIIQKEILNLKIDEFFINADKLFSKNMEDEKKKKEKEKQDKKNEINAQYDFFKNNIIPKIKDYLNEKENKVKNIIRNSKQKCNDLFESEINNASSRIKESDGDIEKATKKLEEKLKSIFEEMKKCQDKETSTILNDIIEKCKESIESHYNSIVLSSSDLEVQKAKAMDMTVTLVSASLTGVATGVGLIYLGGSILSAIAAGTVTATATTTLIGSFFGPLGLVAGLGIGGIITGIGYFWRWYTKDDKYKEALQKSKGGIISRFDEHENNFVNNFSSFKNSLLEELNVKNEVFHKTINDINISVPEWNKIQADYNSKKETIKNKLRVQTGFF